MIDPPDRPRRAGPAPDTAGWPWPDRAIEGRLTRWPAGQIALAGAAAAAAGLALANGRAARAAERRHPPTGTFVTVDGVRLHAVRRGRGRPLLYLHGAGAMAADLDASGLGAALLDGFAVTAFDRPGYGYSGRPRDRAWTARAQARLFARAAAALGMRRPIVVGHSWGALIALALALEHPDEVAGLVLLGGYYHPTARADLIPFALPALPLLGDAARWTIAPPLLRLILPGMLARMFAPRPVPQRFLRRFPLPLALRPGQIRAGAEDSALLVPSAAGLRAQYGRIGVPTTIMAGSDDRVVSAAHHAERLAREVPGAELRLLPGIGHMLHYAAPDLIGRVVREVATRAR